MNNTQIDEIKSSILKCEKCKLSGLNKQLSLKNNTKEYGCPVPGIGSSKAKVMIIGEAPGAQEVIEGKPFVGRSGALLRSSLKQTNITGEELYISNVIRCRPENNKFPDSSKEDISAIINVCLFYLRKEIDIIKPKIIIGCGSKPLKYLFGSDQKISEMVGKMITWKIPAIDFECCYLPVFHPSFCIRPGRTFKIKTEDLSKGQLMMALSQSEKQDIFFNHIKKAIFFIRN